MKFFDKLERKFGKYAIPKLMNYVIVLYIIGGVLSMVNPGLYYEYLALDARMILKGQIWRIFTFLIQPPGGDLLSNLIGIYLYYSLGSHLERVWGSFQFNFYFFMGVIGHVLAAIIIFLTTGQVLYLDTYYLNMSLFFAFAAMYPNYELLLFFMIPVKMKWLALFDGLFFAYAIIFGGWAERCGAILSLMNFLVFFVFTKKSRFNPREFKRKTEFKAKVKMGSAGIRHKCTVCGRTERDGEDLLFRYCTKCEGNYEYCEEHLYTHQHIKKDE